jgi:hemin uptake protein HemP
MQPLHTLAPMPERRTVRPASLPATSLVSDTAPVVQARTLLGQRQSVEIEYNGQRYRLQTTKAGKLILTK